MSDEFEELYRTLENLRRRLAPPKESEVSVDYFLTKLLLIEPWFRLFDYPSRLPDPSNRAEIKPLLRRKKEIVEGAELNPPLEFRN